MRYKSIATKKNFLTGEVVEMEKLKELILPARGIATIELFDAKSGKKVEEIKSENFITLNMKDFLVAEMAKVFSSITLNQNNFNIYPLNESISGYDLTLFLTTDDREEAPNVERFPYGKVIGFSILEPYSGSNIYRGTLNNSESFTQRGLCHMVFDFPTHAANGIFSSLYFGLLDYPFVDSDSYQNSFLFGVPAILTQYKDWLIFQTNKPASGSNVDSFCFDGDNKMYYSTYKTVYAADVVWSSGLDEGRIDTTEAVCTLSSSNNIFDITVTPTHIYCTDGYSSVYKIDKMAKTYQTVNLSSIFEYIYGICWTGDKLIMAGRKQSIGKIASFNANLEVIQAKDLRLRDTISNLPNLQLAYDNLNHEVVYFYTEYINSYYRSFFGRIDTESLSPKGDLVAKYKISSNPNSLEGGVDVRNGIIYAKILSSYTILAIKGCTCFARNLLPSPVEKTSTNTMKVTYDIAII
jgi:hypothetical protein